MTPLVVDAAGIYP